MRLGIGAYALVGVCIISLLFTQTAFAQGTGCDLNSPSDLPSVVLDWLGVTSVKAGETVVFTGKLVCENGYKHSNVEIIIFEDHIFGDDETFAITYTDENGEFSASWIAKNPNLITAEITTIYAKYETVFESGFEWAEVSNRIAFHVNRIFADIFLDPLPSSAEIGEVLRFTGNLELESGNPEGQIVYIKDEDAFAVDDLLATAYVESDGSFSADWIVIDADSTDRIIEIYAVFEGFDIYWRVTTCDYGITKPLGGACQDVIPLEITGEPPPPPPPPPTPPLDSDGDGILDENDLCPYNSENYNDFEDWDGCPDSPPLPPTIPPPPTVPLDSDGDGITDDLDRCPFSKENFNNYEDWDGCPDSPPPPSFTLENLNGDEYFELFYSHQFNSNPVVALVTEPDTYETTRKMVYPAQDGVMMWQSDLEKRFGGNWNVEFIIINAGDKASKRPDIFMNLVTIDDEPGCYDWYGIAFVSSIRPVNTIVCNTSNDVPRTAGHEFIHAMGLGHAFNKPGDMMCSAEKVDGVWVPTCASSFFGSKSNKPQDFSVVAVSKIYGEDGFLNPNNQISWGQQFTATQYLSSDSGSSFTTPTTPPSTPTTPPTTPTSPPESTTPTPVTPTTPTTPITPTTPTTTQKTTTKLPNWIKNNAGWWASGAIEDRDFSKGIEYMIKEEIIRIPQVQTEKEMGTFSVGKIPDWIKNNAKWWSEGKISDDDFSTGIEYMVKVGIIKV